MFGTRRFLTAVLVCGALVGFACTADDTPTAERVPADAGTAPTSSYPELATPEPRPTFVDAAALVDGFVFDVYRPGFCSFDARAQLAMVSPGGEFEWIRDVPWSSEWSHRQHPWHLVGDLVVAYGGRSRRSVYAVDVGTGEPVWQHFVDGGVRDLAAGVPSVALTEGNRLSDEPGHLVALDSDTGAEVWRVDVGRSSTMAAAGDVVVAAGIDSVDAYSRDVGDLVWALEFADNSGPGVRGVAGFIVVVEYPGIVTAHDPVDGAVVWRWEVPDERFSGYVESVGPDGEMVIRVNIDHGEVEADGLPRNGIVVLDGRTGEEVWSRFGADYAAVGSDVMIPVDWADETVPAVIDLATGDELLVLSEGQQATAGSAGFIGLGHDWDHLEGRRVGQPRVVRAVDGSLFFEPQNLEPDHEIVMVGESSDGGTLFVSVADPNAITDDPAGYLVALDSGTGQEVWRVEMRDRVGAAPIELREGRLLVAASDPTIFCD